MTYDSRSTLHNQEAGSVWLHISEELLTRFGNGALVAWGSRLVHATTELILLLYPSMHKKITL